MSAPDTQYRNTHDVYRLILTQTNLVQAIAAYKLRHGRPPGRLTVARAQFDAARALLAGSVKILPVVASGGCLSTEFWLGQEDEKT